MSVNKATILGNVTAQPEIRSTNGGTEIANLSIATNEKWKDKSGNPQKRVEYHRIVIFNQGIVGIVKRFVKKGSKLYIEGQLQTRKWTDKNGVDRYSTEICLNNFGSSLVLLDHHIDKQVEEVEEVEEMNDTIPF